MEIVIASALAALAAALIAWFTQELRGRSRTEKLASQHNAEQMEKIQQIASLEAKIQESQTAASIIDTAKEQMATSFQAAASNALRDNSNQFLTVAQENLGRTMEQAKGEFSLRHEQFQTLVKPLADSYAKLDPRLDEIVKHNTQVATAADRLSNALSDNRQVGTWGEVQLKRIIELAGMAQYCDFSEQQTSTVGNERPDLTVQLPDNRTIIIDAKASTKAYLEAQEAADEQAASQCLNRHAQAMRAQVDDLASKRYGQKVQGSLDFVVMFVPGDQFLSAALRANPQLIEYAMARRVAIATPASLISLLWAVANGWQRHQLAHEAEQLLEIGEEMHKRLQTFINHYDNVGKRISAVIDAYNASVQSFDSRVMPQARRFSQLIAKDEDSLKSPQKPDKALPTSRYATQEQSEAQPTLDLTP